MASMQCTYHFIIMFSIISLQVAIVTGKTHTTGDSSGQLCIEQYDSLGIHQNLHKNPNTAVHCNTSSLAILPELLLALPNSRVHFCTSHIQLDTSIHFQQIYNISFTGIEQKTVINCSESYESGVSFTESGDIHLKNLIFENCGTLQESTSINITGETTLQFYTSLYVFNVTDFSMYNVTVRNSNGLGLAMFDVGGLVTISCCVFKNNSIHTVNDSDDILGGGGVYVEFTYCPPGRYGKNCDDRYSHIVNSTYNISHSHFVDNNASKAMQTKTDFHVNDRGRFQGFGRGGGLQVTFRGKSFGNTIIISKCNFYNNEAFWGGGVKASFQDESQNNTLNILESIFRQNKCFANGGGGANIGYTFYHEPFPRNNKILFSDCIFRENEAKFGGGLAFYSSDSSSSELNNTVEFCSCTWTANKARYGSAVSLSIQAWTTVLSGNLPTPVFSDTKFINNIIIDRRYDSEEPGVFEIYTNGTGAFFATRFTIYFNESIEFIDNNGSAMYLTSSVIKIAPNTSVTFVGNSGFNGGAIALTAFSVIVLGNSTLLTFKNNTAVRCGGAIYSFSIDKHDYLSSRSCFLQNENPITGSPFNVSVSFLNNTVGSYKIGSNSTSYCCGHSVFAISLKPCLYFCKQRSASYNTYLSSMS